MDRGAIARDRRRRQALEALEFERERQLALEEQLTDVIADAEQQNIDAEAFARMDPADAQLVRDTLGDPYDGRHSDEAGFEDLFGGDFSEDDADPATDAAAYEEEITRLQEEIETCKRCQAALERYVTALEPPTQE